MSKCRSVSRVLVFIFLTIFPQLSFAQIGNENLLVPVNMDDPYSYDKIFVSNLVADLYDEQFSFTSSALWVGEHLNDDPAQPRVLGFTNQVPVHDAEEVGVNKNVTFSEISRLSAPWLGYTTSSDVSSVSGVPFFYEIEEYGEVVFGWLDNSDGVSRLVVGIVLVLNFEVIDPAGERAELFFERFYPVKRFFNENQASDYAQDLAEDIDLRYELESGGVGCSTLPAGNEREWCYCLTTIYINYDRDKTSCLGEPDLGEAIRVGVAAGAGAAVSRGIIRRIAKRASGVWGTVTLGVGGFILGSTTMYGGQYAQCMIRAKSTKDAAINHATNAKNQADANGTAFICPTGPR